MTDLDGVVAAVEQRRSVLDRVVVAISGYAGAGKSVLARALVDTLDDAVRVRGDDFLEPSLVHRRSAAWDGVDRGRLRTEVLEPFRAGRPVTVRALDWTSQQLGAATPLPHASVLVLDAVGIFHPDLLPWFDLTVWVDVDLDVAQARGIARDRAAGLDHDVLWTQVWAPNDREFEQTFLPADRSDVRYVS